MVYTYGVIDMKKAYEYISNEIPINFNKFNSIVLFTTYMELDNIYFKSPEMVLANIELTEDQISKLANKKIKLEKYNLKFFKSMADGTYMKNLKEYKSFRNYLIGAVVLIGATNIIYYAEQLVEYILKDIIA